MKKIILTLFNLVLSFITIAAILPILGNTSVCSGTYNLLYDSTAGGTWSSNDTGIVSVVGAGEIHAIATGITTITYTVGTSYVTTIVTVNPTPPPIYGLSQDTICGPLIIYLYDSMPGGGVWGYDGALISLLDFTSNNGDFMIEGSGYSHITFTDTLGCVATVAFRVLAGATFSLATYTIHVGSTTTIFGGWEPNTWTSTNTAIATVDYSSGVVTGISPGIANIYSTNYCGTVGTDVHVLPPVKIQNINLPDISTVTIFPNPANTFITLSAQKPITEITITNLLGQVVLLNHGNKEEVEVDVSGLKNGIYFVIVNGNEVRKFVKL